MTLAAVGSRALESLLFRVTARDSLVFLLAPLIRVLSALLAVHLPARRATRVDPVTVLREG